MTKLLMWVPGGVAAGPWGLSCLQCGVKIRRFPDGGSVSAWLVLAEGARPRKGVNSAPSCGCGHLLGEGREGPRLQQRCVQGKGAPEPGAQEGWPSTAGTQGQGARSTAWARRGLSQLSAGSRHPSPAPKDG